MATGLPVVATRCGDSEELVADTGAITPVGDPTALARAMIELVKLGPETRKELGRRARARISSSYSLEGMAEGYQGTWAEVGGADDRP